MSRIHDALKRAEQERATSLGGNVEPALEQPELQPVSMPEHAHTQTAVMPPLQSSAFSYESLLARCPMAHWSPDTRTMLFFQEDENRKGAEEFRTLRSRLYQIREKLPLKRLMVTVRFKEGKSFVAANGAGDCASARTPRSGDRCRLRSRACTAIRARARCRDCPTICRGMRRVRPSCAQPDGQSLLRACRTPRPRARWNCTPPPAELPCSA